MDHPDMINNSKVFLTDEAFEDDAFEDDLYLRAPEKQEVEFPMRVRKT